MYQASSKFDNHIQLIAERGGFKKMKRMLYGKILLMVMMIALMVNSVSAIPVSSLPGGTVIPIPGVNFYDNGPHSFGPGITWSSTGSDSIFGYTFGYGYLNNGYWNGNLGPMAGLNHGPGTMTFAFSTPLKGVGGFINYAQGYTTAPSTIAVYDANMNQIESETLTFITDGSDNSGEFHGFLETSPEISYFTLSNNVIGITTLTTTTTNGGEVPSVPEFPSAFLPATMIIGLLGVVLLIQRTREH